MIYDPMDLPLRYKITFAIILLTFTVIITPLIAITVYYCYDVFWTFNQITRKTLMRAKLDELHTKIYEPEFNFNSIKKSLKAEFFEIPLKEGEIEL